MKRMLMSCIAAGFVFYADAQSLKDRLNQLSKKDSTGILRSVTGQVPSANTLSNEEIIRGLKEALTIGTDSSAKKLGRLDGFFGNAAIKILMPEEAKKAESTLRKFGMSSIVDKAILSMNRAAEDASKDITPIFWNAIKQMTVQDGLSILRGGDFAATTFLRKSTQLLLVAKMRPVIQASLDKVNATTYWKDVFTAYNRFSNKPVNTDLTAYVTGKAMDGLFHEIALAEQKIRKDPAAQVTDLLKKVFAP